MITACTAQQFSPKLRESSKYDTPLPEQEEETVTSAGKGPSLSGFPREIRSSAKVGKHPIQSCDFPVLEPLPRVTSAGLEPFPTMRTTLERPRVIT